MAELTGSPKQTVLDREPLWQVLARHWQRLTPAERRRLRELVVLFKGRPSNLGSAERAELRILLMRLDMPTLAQELYARRDLLARLRRRAQRPAGWRAT